jgi:hypothetical protein
MALFAAGIGTTVAAESKVAGHNMLTLRTSTLH